jgi:hypothetical protein
MANSAENRSNVLVNQPTGDPQLKRKNIMLVRFVGRVYTMLEDATAKGFDDIIRWEPDGQSFKVHKVKEFEAKVQPTYLNQTRIRSFQRNVRTPRFIVN